MQLINSVFMTLLLSASVALAAPLNTRAVPANVPAHAPLENVIVPGGAPEIDTGLIGFGGFQNSLISSLLGELATATVSGLAEPTAVAARNFGGAVKVDKTVAGQGWSELQKSSA
ncbi:hypothetical protein BDW22DRAFT_1364157 [Trametopsis cervina]|nr:hypothetical protein BDW22DRAFT_1364157 [Trametopsis cervina]